MVYEPREDSYLLHKHIPKYAKGRVLDMGTGSGILAEVASETAAFVIAADMDPEAVSLTKVNVPTAKTVKSNLFSHVTGQFDLITFNPPYLPSQKPADRALDGGKHGYELIWKFLDQAPEYVKKNGVILLLFSSVSKKMKVEEGIERNGFVWEEVAAEKLFGEVLYVYKIEHHPLLKNIAGLQNARLLAKGKRSHVYRGKYRGRDVALKLKNPKSKAVGKMAIEGTWLHYLQKYGIGPRLVKKTPHYVMYEYVPGMPIGKYLNTASKQDIIRVFRNVLKQCRTLDELQLDKEEMHHPTKHILIGKKIVLIDFERCHKVRSAKNVTQFVQFITSGAVERQLKNKHLRFPKEKLHQAAQWYKKDQSDQNMKQILKLVK